MWNVLLATLSIIGYNVVAYNLISRDKIQYKTLIGVLCVDVFSLLMAQSSFMFAGIVLFIGHCFIVKLVGYKVITSIIGNVFVVLVLILVDSTTAVFPFFPFNMVVDTSKILTGTEIRLYKGLFLIPSYWIFSYGIKVFIIRGKDWLDAINNSRYQTLGLGFGLGAYILFYYLVFNTNLTAQLVWINTVVFSITLIAYVTILFLMHNASVHAEKVALKEMELAQLATYTENLEFIYTDMRKIRHDFINVLSSMVGFLETRDMDGLIGYFSENVVSFSSQVNQINLNLGLLGYLEQSEIKGLLAIKVLKAEEAGIAVNVDIAEPIYFKDANTLELCRVIGILMDNSIEAAIKSEKPEISVALLNKINTQMIVIINSHSEEIASIAKLFEKGYSTKGEDRGFGLSNVRDIVNRYAKWSLDTEFNDVMFTQVIELER